MKLVHYGAKAFDKKLFNKITNKYSWMNKPGGGLWTSPIKSNHSWLKWCEENEYREYEYDNCFYITLKDNAKILKVDSIDDLKGLPLIKTTILEKDFIDFKKLYDVYDCIWLTEIGETSTRYTNPLSLYGWDCESVFIMNPNCFTMDNNF